MDLGKEDSAGSASSALNVVEQCPLKPMTEMERLVADYAGMGLSAGRHPMALKRDELAMRGIRRYFIAERGRPAGSLVTRGYWRLGTANHPDHDYGDD